METSGEAICGPLCSFITHQDLETMETSGLFHYSPGPEAMETSGLFHYSPRPETMKTSGLFHYSPGFRGNGDLWALSLLTWI